MGKIYRISESQLEVLLTNKKSFNDGLNANKQGDGLEKNPHTSGTNEYNNWRDGWLSGEAKSQQNHDEVMLKKEIGENDENITENDQTDNIFTSEIKGISGIDVDVNFGSLFTQTKPGTGGYKLLVNGIEYDPNIMVSLAKTKYSIDVEYSSYGIKSINIIPISVTFIGVVEIIGDEAEYKKDFELSFDRSGLKVNTLSGSMDLGGNVININNLSSEVTFETERVTNNDSYYVSSVTLSLNPNLIIFKY